MNGCVYCKLQHTSTIVTFVLIVPSKYSTTTNGQNSAMCSQIH